jgi:hypothetical protein
MATLTRSQHLRLLNVLHHGLVELRNLSYAGRTQEAAELADRLEIIPVYLAKWQDSFWDEIRGSLLEYQRRASRSVYDYTLFMDNDPPPDFTQKHSQ